MNSKNLSNRKIKVTFFTLFVTLFLFISSTNVKSANNGAVTINVSPNQITSEGSTSTTANISVSSDYPIANYLLTVTVNGQVVSTPTGLGLNEAKSHTINPIKINLSGPGNYEISVSGEISINNGTDYESINVANSATVTVSAPTPKATPTPAPKATPTPKPSPTTKKTSNNTTATTKAKPSTNSENNNKNYKSINKKMVVTTDLDIRSNASLSSTYLGSFDKGTVVDVIGVTDDGWYVINYNGKTAYLAGSYLNDYSASTPNSTRSNSNNNNSNSKKTTSSKKDSKSNTSTTSKDDKTKETTKARKTTTSKTSTLETTTKKSDSGLIIGANDSNTNMQAENNKIKSLFSKLDPTMLIVIALIILLIILMIVYYILKKRILEDEEQDEFEELPGDNDEAIYANKSSKIQVSRVNDSENSKNNTEN